MNHESFDAFLRRDGVEAMHQINETERQTAVNERREEFRQKYAGINTWTAEDWRDMAVNYAKNRPMYHKMEADGTFTWHLWGEDGKQDKRKAACTIKAIYQDGRETAEDRSVMVCTLPEDSEEVIEGKATVRFTWTEKEAKQEVNCAAGRAYNTLKRE
jgi:hypothetical protein